MYIYVCIYVCIFVCLIYIYIKVIVRACKHMKRPSWIGKWYRTYWACIAHLYKHVSHFVFLCLYMQRYSSILGLRMHLLVKRAVFRSGNKVPMCKKMSWRMRWNKSLYIWTSRWIDGHTEAYVCKPMKCLFICTILAHMQYEYTRVYTRTCEWWLKCVVYTGNFLHTPKRPHLNAPIPPLFSTELWVFPQRRKMNMPKMETHIIYKRVMVLSTKSCCKGWRGKGPVL